MYITSFFEIKNTDYIYISTLNDGVHFAGHNHKNFKQLPESPNVSFIKDIIATNDHRSNLITLTNQHVLFDNDDYSIRARGLKKLIQINDSIFASIPQRGLNMYAIREKEIVQTGQYFEDISFNPNACLVVDDKLVLGSDVGSLIVFPQEMNNPQWTIFGEIVNVETLSIIFLVVLFFVVLAIYVISHYLTKSIVVGDAQLIRLKDDQINRIIDVQTFTDQSDDIKLKQEVINIQTYLYQLEIEDKTITEKKHIKNKLEIISLQIANINRKISLHFPLKISEQKELLNKINNTEAKERIKKIENINEIENTNLIYTIIIENNHWIERYNNVLDNMETDIETLSSTFVISKINEGLCGKLIELKNNIPIMGLDEISSAYNQIKKQIDDIDSAKNKELIKNAIQEKEDKLMFEIYTDKKLSSLGDFLKDIKKSVQSNSNICILKQLKLLDDQIKVLNILNQIKEYSIEYKKSTDCIIKKNNERIKKKHEIELNAEIESANKLLADKINTLITDFYKILPAKDSAFISNILKINNENSQNARVMALLLANKRIKRTIIPKILGIYGNLNPVISRLMNDRIRPNVEQIQNYKTECIYSVFIIRIIELLDCRKNSRLDD